MRQAPRHRRYWFLLGVLVACDLVLAGGLIWSLHGRAVSPLALVVEPTRGGLLPSPTAVLATASPSVVATTPIIKPTLTRAPTEEPIKPLTLDEIFPPRDLSPLKLDPARLSTIIATGDVVPARSTDVIIRARKDDFLYPITPTKDLLSKADITVIDLEAPLLKDCPYHNSGFKFCGRPGFVQALTAAGVDVATLENNHVMNYGTEGVTETIKSLQAAGITSVRADSPAIVDVRGTKFGFIALNGVGERINRETMVARIQALRPKVDVLVMAIHWGAEYVALPAAAPGIAPDSPVEIAHLAVDNGADLIIGNHPHWIQPVELYKGKLIAYAHGNFIFDQMWSDETRQGVIGIYTFYDRTLVKAEYVPVLIQNYAQPVPMQGKASADVLDKMKAASRQLINAR